MEHRELDLLLKGLRGSEIKTPVGTWTVRVDGYEEPPANNTRWRITVRLIGQVEYLVTLVAFGESLFVEHDPGDPSWILASLRLWLLQPDAEKGAELSLMWRPPAGGGR